MPGGVGQFVQVRRIAVPYVKQPNERTHTHTGAGAGHNEFVRSTATKPVHYYALWVFFLFLESFFFLLLLVSGSLHPGMDGLEWNSFFETH